MIRLTRSAMLALALAVIAAPAVAQRAPDLNGAAADVISLGNRFRREQSLANVAPNAQLSAAANQFAAYLARTGKLDHQADGSEPAARAARQGYDYCIVSENLAYEYNSRGFTADALARAFVEGWKASPGHRRNLLDPDVTETGVAVARSEKGYYYAVQMFGRPTSQSMEFEIANRSNAVVPYKLGGVDHTLPPKRIRTHTVCRPDELVVAWPGNQRATALRPRNGDKLDIVRSKSGEFRVQPQ
jgi:uncharacterized protein YkwD